MMMAGGGMDGVTLKMYCSKKGLRDAGYNKLKQ